MSRSRTASAFVLLALTTQACGPMEVEIVNATGADLVLDMPEQQEIVPPGTTVFAYKGAPSFNKRWTIPIEVSGDYVLTDLSVEGVRDEIASVSFGEADVNAFVVELENNTGARIDSIFFQHPADGAAPLEDGLRPGQSAGSIAPGESLSLSLPHRGEGWNYVYYQQGEGTVDSSGRVNTDAAGQDVVIALGE